MKLSFERHSHTGDIFLLNTRDHYKTNKLWFTIFGAMV